MDAAAATEAVAGLKTLGQLTDDERSELEGMADGAGVLVETLQGLVIDEAAGRMLTSIDLEAHPDFPPRVGAILQTGGLEPTLVVRRTAGGHRSCYVKLPGQLVRQRG